MKKILEMLTNNNQPEPPLDLQTVLRKRTTDYKPWGKVERWKDPEANYPDCSCGCKHFKPLYNEKTQIDCDYGVCTNPKSARCGLLTFEHQAGKDCFENDVKEEN